MAFKYIDIHAHLNLSDYDLDREKVIRDAENAGVMIINVGTDLETSKKAVEIANKYPENCRAIVGMHPTCVDDQQFDYESFKKLATDKMVVGIGECGLDYFHESDKDLQEKVFRQQIELAIEIGKPLMIHARDSYINILSILDEYLISTGIGLKGDVHFFAGSVEEAKAFLNRGFTMSFTGVVTFAKQYKELVEFIPAEMMMSETDCPYVTPMPFRGTRNEPKYIPLIVAKMAEIKGISEELMAMHIMQNAKRVFGV